jgi:hypothetical protein
MKPPKFTVASRGPLGGIGIHLSGASDDAVWTHPLCHIPSAQDANNLVDALNRLLSQGILRVENIGTAHYHGETTVIMRKSL